MKLLRSFVAVATLVLVGAAGANAADDWQRIHGQVQSVSGNTVTVKADDGRVLTVDAAQVSNDIRGALTPNAGVTLIGKAGVGQTPSTQSPSASPTGVDDKSWQRIHGTVSSASGSTLSLKADDGRNLNVDLKDVDEAIRQSLSSGEKVTVIGFYRGDQNTVAARYVQKDSSAK